MILWGEKIKGLSFAVDILQIEKFGPVSSWPLVDCLAVIKLLFFGENEN
jgi:hypothetical protein